MACCILASLTRSEQVLVSTWLASMARGRRPAKKNSPRLARRDFVDTARMAQTEERKQVHYYNTSRSTYSCQFSLWLFYVLCFSPPIAVHSRCACQSRDAWRAHWTTLHANPLQRLLASRWAGGVFFQSFHVSRWFVKSTFWSFLCWWFWAELSPSEFIVRQNTVDWS